MVRGPSAFYCPAGIIPGHNLSKEALMNRKGFTLVELLTVVAILGILAMIAIPGYIGYHKRAQRNEAYSNLQNLRLLEEQYFAENNTYILGANTNALKTALPGFRPGSSLNFDYAVTIATGVGLPTPVPFPYANTTANLNPNTTPCFIATATGNSSRVAGDVFAIDCNNNRNF
jgi:prepilin-type N-terminal cleavage/methylation domain-containing protein